MMDPLAGQVVWVGIFLVLGGLGKAAELRRGGYRVSLLSRISPRWLPIRVALAALCALEFIVGTLILTGVSSPVPEAAAAALLALAAGVAAWGIRRAPGVGCGCMGAFSDQSVGWQTVARAGTLAAMATVAAASGRSWTASLDSPVSILALLIGLSVLLWLSPDIRPGRLSRLVRAAHDARCGRWYISKRRTLRRLRATELWLVATPWLLTKNPSDHWRQECWQFLSFPASNGIATHATAIFALSINENGSRSLTGSITLVDEESRSVLERIVSNPLQPTLSGEKELAEAAYRPWADAS